MTLAPLEKRLLEFSIRHRLPISRRVYHQELIAGAQVDDIFNPLAEGNDERGDARKHLAR